MANPQGEDVVDREREALAQSEERFRLLVESVQDYAIFMLDPEGHIASWNAGAERIKGYRAEEILGAHFSRFYPAEALAAEWPREELDRARRTGRCVDEGWRIRKDGSRFWAHVVITAVYDGSGRLRGFAKVTRDMTQPKQIEALEGARRGMNELLAMLGHELRNPLAPIGNAVAILRAEGLTDGKLRWATEVLERQTGQLRRIVDDLLDVGRITSGKVLLRKEPLDVTTVLSRAIEASRPAIDARHQKLLLSLPEQALHVEGDLTRLSQVVLNLLDNAAKYTPEGGHIWLSAAPDQGQVAIRVRDDGIGMGPELLPHIFEIFSQGERALDRAEGGLGIGLTLVRELVHLHGGRVEAWSGGAGRGSELVVYLPLRLVTAADPDEGLSSPLETSRAERRRVLVVDDNQDAAESLALLLGIWGHDVRTALDGSAGLALAAEYRPDVILLDIGLPGMDGYEVARGLRALPGMHSALLVAMTGYGRDEDRRRAYEAGFAVHLVKPVPPETLRELIDRAVSDAAPREPPE